VCADTEYDITQMQPQLFVARDFEHLFQVLEEFESTLAWRRGGDYGLREAERARSVNHLVLSDGREVTGKVVGLIEGTRPVATGLSTALVRLEGPVLLSRGEKAVGRPWTGAALVAFGAGTLPERGDFALELASGLRLSGFAVGEGEVLNLRASVGGRELEMPSVAKLYLGEGLPSVAGGPADPGTWDKWFGELNAFAEGDGEARARARKAEALSPQLAALYREARALRESRDVKPERVEQLTRAVAAFPNEWLLLAEVMELREALSVVPSQVQAALSEQPARTRATAS
jgi:phenylalanine-4-hydroxylase